MQLPRHLFAAEPEFDCVIRTIAPRFIGRLDPDVQGDDVLEPEADGTPIVVHQWIDPRPSVEGIQSILAEIAEDYFEHKEALAAVEFRSL